jgi:dihydroorotase-like cyclic amidohydrolase
MNTNVHVFILSFLVDFVLDQKNVPLLEAYDKWRNWADGKVYCDYALHSCVTWWSPEVAKEMEILCKEKGTYQTHIK